MGCSEEGGRTYAQNLAFGAGRLVSNLLVNLQVLRFLKFSLLFLLATPATDPSTVGERGRQVQRKFADPLVRLPVALASPLGRR